MRRVLICSVILAAFMPAFAWAKDAPQTDLQVSPAITEWLALPGGALQQNVAVINTTREPLPVSALVRPFQLQGAEQLDSAATARYDASAWLRVKDGDFILKPGESRKVTVALEVPKDAPPGGHYATVYFRQLRPAGSTGAEAQVGALAFITVKGEVVKRLEGEHMEARWDGDTLTMAATLRNAGNVHVMPEGEFIILDWFGNEIERVALPRGMVMPQTARSYHAAFKDRGFGMYTVKPVLSYGNGQALDLPSVTAWAMPWKAMVAGVLAVAAGWFGVYRVRGRWKRAFSALTQRNR